MTTARCALWVAAVALAACGSDEPAGPTGRDLRGTWAYSASGITPGPPPICSIGAITVTISSHSGTGFGGNHTPGVAVCNGGGYTNDTFAIGAGTLTSGVATADSVRFNFTTEQLRHFGTVRGDTMSGFLNLSTFLNGTIPTVATGNWMLVRQ